MLVAQHLRSCLRVAASVPVLIVSPPLAFTFAPLAVCVVCMRRERQQEDTSELI